MENINKNLNCPVSEESTTEQDRKPLSPREFIRLWPGMWIGKLGDGGQPDDGIYTLIQELVSNSVDEFIMGAGKQIEITIDPQSSRVTIRNYGRGIPLKVLKDVVSKYDTTGKYRGLGVFKKQNA